MLIEDRMNSSGSPITIVSTLVAATVLAGGCYYYYFVVTVTKKKRKSVIHNDTSINNPLRQPPPPPPYASVTLAGYGKIVQENKSIINLYKWIKECNSNCFLLKSPIPIIIPDLCVVADPTVVKDLLLNKTNMYREPGCKFIPRPDNFAKFIADGEGYSVSAIPGNQYDWKWRKNALLKQFHTKRLYDPKRKLIQQILTYINTTTCQKLEEIITNTGNETKIVTIEELNADFTIRTILFFIFGRDNITFDLQKLKLSGISMVQFVFHRAFTPWHPISKYFPWTNCYKQQQMKDTAWTYIDSIVQKEIEMMIDEHKGIRPIHPDRNPGSALAELFQLESKYLEIGITELLDDIRVLIMAGFETTTIALAFALGLTAEYPHIGDIIANEIKNSSYDMNTVDPNDIPDLLLQCPLAKSLFLESIRLFPPVWALPGLCKDNIIIQTSKNVKHTIQSGTQVVFSLFYTNRYSHVDTIKNEINLNNWNNDNTNDNNNNNDKIFNMAFNIGTHVCAGKNLAILESHLYLLTIISKYKFKFPKGVSKVEWKEGVFLFPKDGMPLIVEKRQ